MGRPYKRCERDRIERMVKAAELALHPDLEHLSYALSGRSPRRPRHLFPHGDLRPPVLPNDDLGPSGLIDENRGCEVFEATPGHGSRDPSDSGAGRVRPHSTITTADHCRSAREGLTRTGRYQWKRWPMPDSATIQKPAPPKSGDILISCGHFEIGKQVGWFWCSPLAFRRGDGTLGAADWIVACPTCHEDALSTGIEPSYLEGQYDGKGIVMNRNLLRVTIGPTGGDNAR